MGLRKVKIIILVTGDFGVGLIGGFRRDSYDMERKWDQYFGK